MDNHDKFVKALNSEVKDGEHDQLKSYSTEVPKAEARWTKILFLAAVVTVFGGSGPLGYNLGVINSSAEVVKQFCNASVFTRYGVILNGAQLDSLWACIVSIFLIGGAVGSLSGSVIADRIGRKNGLIVSAILGIIGSILFLVSKSCNSIELILLGRLLVGLSGGLVTTVMPMYVMELSPESLRGATGTLCQLGITSGILVGQILSMRSILGNPECWEYCLSVVGIPQLICAFLIAVLPESPKYLFIIKKHSQRAIKALTRVRERGEEYLIYEINALKIEERDNLEQGESWSISKVLKDGRLLLPVLLVCFLQLGQQLSGVNAVFYYSSTIFKQAGLSVTSREWATIGTGICNILMAAVSIQTMTWFKRRALLQISLITSLICLVVLGISIALMKTISWMPYICVIAMLAYVLCYGLGLGPIPYFVGSELFESGPRSSAMALGGMANWGGNFLVGLAFPTMQNAIGPSVFYIFAMIVFALFMFVRIYLPETKGKNSSEIYHLVENGLKSRPLRST